MKNKIGKKKILIILMVIALLTFIMIGIPVIINELYKNNRGYLTLWGADDVLSFYGTILGAIGGIVGVFFTVRYSIKQYQEDARQRIMPFISFENLADKNLYKEFSAIGDESIPSHMKLSIVVNSEGKVLYRKHLPSTVIDIIKRNVCRTFTDENDFRIIEFKKYYFTVFKLRNIGYGAALRFIVGIHSDDKKALDTKEFAGPKILDKGEYLYVGMYVDLSDEKSLKKYNLDFLYSDIGNTRYIQQVVFDFSKNEQGHLQTTITYKGEHKKYYDNRNDKS